MNGFWSLFTRYMDLLLAIRSDDTMVPVPLEFDKR